MSADKQTLPPILFSGAADVLLRLKEFVVASSKESALMNTPELWSPLRGGEGDYVAWLETDNTIWHERQENAAEQTDELWVIWTLVFLDSL